MDSKQDKSGFFWGLLQFLNYKKPEELLSFFIVGLGMLPFALHKAAGWTAAIVGAAVLVVINLVVAVWVYSEDIRERNRSK